MRHGSPVVVPIVVFVVAVGCGFETPAGTHHGPGVSETWSFESAAKFTAAGAALEDMTVEARDAREALTPNAYTYGGLVAHGLQGTALWSSSDTAWTKVNIVTPSGAGLWRGERLSDASGYGYVGITNKATMTIWFEGEVYLDHAKPQSFALFGDDVAFIELAPPGTTNYTQILKVNDTVAVEVPKTGWYPIRIGFADGDNTSTFEFLHSDAGVGTPQVAWTRDRLRARTSELPGLLRTVFGRQMLGGGVQAIPPVPRFELGALLPQTDFNPAPQGTSSSDDWSARYVGQIYIEQAGMYTLQVTSDDGNRVRLGAGHGDSHWRRDDAVGPRTTTTVQTPLVAGWNDVIVDYNQVGGGRYLRMQLQGPDFPSPTEVPRARLRPVEPADDRLASSVDDTDHTIPDATGATPGTAIAQMEASGYNEETVTAIEVTYQIDSQHWGELKVELERPGLAAPVTLRDPAGLSNGSHILQISAPSTNAALGALLGGPVGGTWTLRASDTVANAGTSNLQSARLTLHTTGDPDKIARKASWTSPVLAPPTSVIAIDKIAWDARVPSDGGAVEVRVRTCMQAGCADDPAWSAPVTRDAAQDIDAGGYLQVRVEMASNGLVEPELRSLAITYRRSE